MLSVFFILILLIGVNALFVASEFAAVSVPQNKIKEMALKKHPAARLLWPILSNTHTFDNYVAACQVGITISSLILGAYGQSHLGEWLAPYFSGSEQFSYLLTPGILVVLTTSQMIFGELVPKSLALQFPIKVSIWTTFPMVAALSVLRLPIALLNGSGNFLLRLMGFEPEAHRHIHSGEEIVMLLTEGEDAGFLDSHERERMEKAIQLGNWTARDIMVPQAYLQRLYLNRSVKKNLKRIASTNTSSLLVQDDENASIVGHIRCQEVLRYQMIHGEIKDFSSFIHPLLAVPRNLTLQRLLEKFRSHKTRMALVVDEYGTVAGLVTLQDVLAEFTGAIGDEAAYSRNHFFKLSDQRVRVSGQMRLDQLKSKLGIDWVSEYSNTVGGFVLDHLDQLPYRGQILQVDNMTVEIDKVSARAILSVIIGEMPEC